MFIVQPNNPGPIEAFNTWIMIGSILFSSSVHPQFYVTKRHDKMIYMSRTSWNQSVDCEVLESTTRLCHNLLWHKDQTTRPERICKYQEMRSCSGDSLWQSNHNIRLLGHSKAEGPIIDTFLQPVDCPVDPNSWVLPVPGAHFPCQIF